MSNYTTKNQPCDNYTPQQDSNEHAQWDNEHECPPCAKASSGFARRSYCLNCHKDHHDGGWDKHVYDATPDNLPKKEIDNV